MKVFLVGGTGLVGSYLIPGLLNKGYGVFALTRSEEKVKALNQTGARGIVGDFKEINSFRKELPDKLDIIVLLAMPGIKPGKKLTKKGKQALRDETTLLFRNAMDLAIEYGIPVILPSGTSYRTKDNEIADETWPISREGITGIGADTDEMVRKAIETQHPKLIQLIYGKIYGNGGLFRMMYDMTDKNKGKIIGSGDNYVPNIHAADAASAVILAIEKMPVGEKFIIADDDPVSLKEFSYYMAGLMNRKKPSNIPGFIIKLILGKDFYELTKLNCKVSNEKAKKILGWKPAFPSYKEGLKQVIDEIRILN